MIYHKKGMFNLFGIIQVKENVVLHQDKLKVHLTEKIMWLNKHSINNHLISLNSDADN